jgi:hypothetical protein
VWSLLAVRVRPARVSQALLPYVVAYGFAVCLVGLRDESALTGDTRRYVFTFSKLTSIESADLVGKIYFGSEDYLYWPLQALIAACVETPQVWLAVNALLTFALLILAAVRLRKIDAAWVPAGFAIPLSYFTLYAGNGMRQALSLAVFMVCLSYVLQRNLTKSLVLFALAVMLHISSLAYTPVLLLTRVSPKTNRWMLLSVPLFCLLSGRTLLFDLAQSLAPTDGRYSDRVNVYLVQGVSASTSPQQSIGLWLVLIVGVAWFFTSADNAAENQVKLLYCYGLSIVAFTVFAPEVWARFLVPLYLLMPYAAYKVVTARIKSRETAQAVWTIAIAAQAILWLSSSSARTTLGY